MGLSSAKWMVLIHSFPLFVAFSAFVAINFDLRYLSTFVLAAVGCSLILFAKFRQKTRTGRVISFTLQGMSAKEKTAYFAGYGMYLITFAICIYLFRGAYF